MTQEEWQAKRSSPEAKAKVLASRQAAQVRTMTPEYRFPTIKARAKTRGIEFTITREEFLALWPAAGACCPVCLNEMRQLTQHAPSVDRRDNSKGYVSGNVGIICKRCNTLKSEIGSNHLYRLGLYAAGLLGNAEYKTDPVVVEQARAIQECLAAKVVQGQ